MRILPAYFTWLPAALLSSALLCLLACGSNDHQPGDGHNHAEAGADEKHHDPAPGVLELTSEQIKAVGIVLGGVEQKNLSAVVRAGGQLEVPPQNKADVTTLVGGVIRRIRALEGANVVKGQVLAWLENPDFIKLQQEYVTAKHAFTYTEQEYQRQRDLDTGKSGTGKVYQQAEANYRVEKARISALEKQLQQLGIPAAAALAGNFATQIPLRAPIGGSVSHIAARIGTFAEPGKPLMEIVDNSQIHCDLLVYEKDLFKVKVGQKVNFILTNQDNQQITGTIYGVNQSFENESKAVVVHARIAGSNRQRLIPGMYVSALIDVGNQVVSAVPVEAVVQAEGKNYLFVLSEAAQQHEGEGAEKSDASTHEAAFHFEKVEVVTGVSELGFVEITPLAPLPKDAQVVTKGAFYLQSKGTEPEEHGH